MIRLKVEGMSCNHCKLSVEKALKGVPGVEGAEVNLAQGTAQVYGTPQPEPLLEAVRAEGYEAEVLR